MRPRGGASNCCPSTAFSTTGMSMSSAAVLGDAVADVGRDRDLLQRQPVGAPDPVGLLHEDLVILQQVELAPLLGRQCGDPFGGFPPGRDHRVAVGDVARLDRAAAVDLDEPVAQRLEQRQGGLGPFRRAAAQPVDHPPRRQRPALGRCRPGHDGDVMALAKEFEGIDRHDPVAPVQGPERYQEGDLHGRRSGCFGLRPYREFLSGRQTPAARLRPDPCERSGSEISTFEAEVRPSRCKARQTPPKERRPRWPSSEMPTRNGPRP